MGCKTFGQRVAIDELQHEAMDRLVLDQVVDRGDMRMVEGREHLRLALKPHDAVFVT